MKINYILRLFVFVVLSGGIAKGQVTAFTYQGRLNDGGSAANGIYDLRFAIYDAATVGGRVAGPVTNSPVTVSNGLFTVTLDFGASAFDGGARWLEIGVRPNGSASDFTTLSPRQPLTPTPYALYALTAGTVPDGAITSSKLASGAAAANLQAGGQSAVAGGGIVLSEQANAIDLLNAGYVKLGRANLIDESWLPRTNGPPFLGPAALARVAHSAVWTGTEMIIWGGFDGIRRDNGARYNPSANTWTQVSTVDAPAARSGHSAVWTGTEMIVFGGLVTGNFLTGGIITTNTGARYNPATDTWTPITAGGGSRRNHAAFWTGSRMLIWGGTYTYTGTFGPGEAPRNDGALYDPATDSWTGIASTGAPSVREGFSAVWSGTDMIIWGGWGTIGSFFSTRTNFNDGARYNLAANTWSPMSSAGAPFRRHGHSAVWSGSQMIVWGGVHDETFAGAVTNYNDGARYNPGANTWSGLSTAAAPTPRYDHTAIWLGNRMVVWGGTDGTNLFNSGGRYFPGLNTWSNMTVSARPTARSGNSAITSGSEMIVWGGQNEDGIYLDIGGRYNATTDVWQATARTGERSPRRGHTAVWTGSELLVWGGFDGESYLNSGGRFNPALNSWTPMNMTNAPAGRIGHSAIWNGTEMIVWGGSNTTLLNSGGRYNLASDSWSATSTGTGTPTARNGHTAVWSGNQMIVWGGFDGAFRNTGARYNPVANTWSATAGGAPAARSGHAAVWTGTEMLVWGGVGGTVPSPVGLSSGGRYDPVANVWAALPNPGAPAARTGHKGVWTGEEFLVWGGTDLTTNLNSGGRYNYLSNTWNAMTLNNAPVPRIEHTTVWAGTRMMVWGGLNGDSYLSSGGGYDPLTDVWLPFGPSTNTPPARSQHVTAWTGTEMVIHGGWNGSAYFEDTHHYAPARTMFLYLKP
jgi:N-acetylneuraminic acid mutarotase